MLPNESFFLKNHELNNPKAIDKGTPLLSNYEACDLELPAGENYSNGEYYSPLTNETYSWTYNSNGVNFIQRINGNGECQVVYSGSCLLLNPDPRNKITQFRAYLKLDRLCANQHGKRLVWVDGTDTPIGMIDVEASIATNFFTTPFFDVCADECSVLQMCVPEPDKCLNGEFVPYSSADAGKSNMLLDKGFKFMYRYVYYDGRTSEWSDRSSLYFQDAKGCFDTGDGFPRCIKFRLPVGNPLVDIIEFAFSEDGGVTYYISERIEKYKKYNNAQQYWYERGLSELVSATFSEDDCSFDYIFCNDKQRNAVDPTSLNRLVNPLPREPQGLFPIKEGLAFYNYKKGNCPVDKTEIEKLSISLNCTTVTECKTEFATIKVRTIIHSTLFDRNQFIFREGTGATDDLSDTAKFGGLNPALDSGYVDPSGYDQTFSGKTRNFIVYVEGTDFWAEMKQWHSSAYFQDKSLYGIVVDMGNTKTRNKWRKDSRHDNFFFQEATIKVPRGTKGFLRLSSHHSEGNNQDTSTFVYGIYDDLGNYRGEANVDTHTNKQGNEIYFDTCDGDLDIRSAFVIQDNATGQKAYYGYLKDNDGKPVEGAVVIPVISGEAPAFQSITDFNGFFHTSFIAPIASDIEIRYKVELNCGDFGTAKSSTIQLEDNSNTNIGTVRITNDDNSFYTNTAYADINVPVIDCDGKPLAGIRVALSGSKYATTRVDGIAVFKIRNYYTRNRVVRAVIADHNGCFTLDCAGMCNPCFNAPEQSTPACYITNQPTVTLDSISLNKQSALVNRKGLKNGGRYAFAVVAEGNCGRISAAYEIGYIDIPKAQESGAVQFCDFNYTSSGLRLPSFVNRLKIVRSANLNPFELQWVVDKIEKTDDGKIKLTIQSLNDYNAKYFFKTNTVYQYLKGDRVEFIKNGDGTIFLSSKDGVLNYLTLSPFNDESISGVTTASDANYFNQLLIEDDGKLDTLTEGALIEIQRPKEATTEIEYFEICASIPVETGVLLYPTGTFSTFDTYLVSRTVGRFSSQLFEHHSPSDFWGERITDIGKVHFLNRYENERRYGRNIILNSPTQYNYFGDFEKTLDAQEQGDIIGIALKGDKIGLAICENAPFLFQVNDDLLRLGSDGVVRAASVDNLISNPEVNLRGSYGCQYEDIGSILFSDGFAMYIDSKNNGYIVHNYSSAKKAGVSIQQGEIVSTCNSYFEKQIRGKENFNATAENVLDYFRWSTGQNKTNNIIYLTLKSLRHAGINNASQAYELPNETISYNVETDDFMGFTSFTPEGYSSLTLNNSTGCAFITYQNSLPYIHEVIATKWNSFYGIAVDEYIGVTANADKKILIPISVEIQSEQMFFVKRVTTDNKNFVSEIPPKKMEQNQEGKWNASFLGNSNSRIGLYGNENARGYFANVLLIKDNTDNLKYNSVNTSKQEMYNEISDILIKFMLSESSGQTENL